MCDARSEIRGFVNWYRLGVFELGNTRIEYMRAHSAIDAVFCVEKRNGGGRHVRQIQCLDEQDVPADEKTMVLMREKFQHVD